MVVPTANAVKNSGRYVNPQVLNGLAEHKLFLERVQPAGHGSCAERIRVQSRDQAGAAMHAKFCVDTALVGDNRARGYTHRVTEIPLLHLVAHQQQAYLLFPHGQVQSLDPPQQRKGTRCPSLDCDPDVPGLFNAVARSEPVGTQYEFTPWVPQGQDGWLLRVPSRGDAGQSTAKPGYLGQTITYPTRRRRRHRIKRHVQQASCLRARMLHPPVKVAERHCPMLSR